MSVATATAEHASRRPSPRRLQFPVPLLLLLPALVLFLVFFVLPLGVLVVNSFHDYSRLTGIVPTFTFKNYSRIVGDGFYLEIVVRTLRLAFLTSCVTLIIGYPIALYLTIASARQRAWIILFILSPLLVSVIVRTFGWLIILGPNGLIQNMIAPLGLRVGSSCIPRPRSSSVSPTCCCRSSCCRLRPRCRRSIRRCRWRLRAWAPGRGGCFGWSPFR
jgi:ABC-type spermidine/putrescine transport system permease subunit I